MTWQLNLTVARIICAHVGIAIILVFTTPVVPEKCILVTKRLASTTSPWPLEVRTWPCIIGIVALKWWSVIDSISQVLTCIFQLRIDLAYYARSLRMLEIYRCLQGTVNRRRFQSHVGEHHHNSWYRWHLDRTRVEHEPSNVNQFDNAKWTYRTNHCFQGR